MPVPRQGVNRVSQHWLPCTKWALANPLSRGRWGHRDPVSPPRMPRGLSLSLTARACSPGPGGPPRPKGTQAQPPDPVPVPSEKVPTMSPRTAGAVPAPSHRSPGLSPSPRPGFKLGPGTPATSRCCAPGGRERHPLCGSRDRSALPRRPPRHRSMVRAGSRPEAARSGSEGHAIEGGAARVRAAVRGGGRRRRRYGPGELLPEGRPSGGRGEQDWVRVPAAGKASVGPSPLQGGWAPAAGPGLGGGGEGRGPGDVPVCAGAWPRGQTLSWGQRGHAAGSRVSVAAGESSSHPRCLGPAEGAGATSSPYVWPCPSSRHGGAASTTAVPLFTAAKNWLVAQPGDVHQLFQTINLK